MSGYTDAQGLLARLSRLETGQVSDVLDEAGLTNHALDTSILPLVSHGPVAGLAACVRGSPISNAAHSPPTLPVDTLESLCTEGTVLFIDSCGFVSGAVIGGFVAYSLQREGCRAVITNGAVRDVKEIRSYDIPCYATRVVPNNGARRWRLTEKDVPVEMPSLTGGSVTIRPNDYILADDDGIVVVPHHIALQIIEDSEVLACIEETIAEELKSGNKRAEVFKRNPRFKHIRAAPPIEFTSY